LDTKEEIQRKGNPVLIGDSFKLEGKERTPRRGWNKKVTKEKDWLKEREDMNLKEKVE